jgi:arsenite methyltransferase
MQDDKKDKIRGEVRERYAQIADDSSSCCGQSSQPSCDCGSSAPVSASELRGYSRQDLDGVPEGADMVLGCGNPKAIADLKPGEVVLDLGSGGGLDCFLAADTVGEGGRVIGVDMTPEMIARARDNARKSGHNNVEFRLGEIEHIPAADASVDVVISNCVINLSPDKPAVYRDAYRVLKPGGRLAIADMIAVKPMPREILEDPDLMCKCVAGAATKQDLENMLREAGFEDIRIEPKDESREFVKDWSPGSDAEEYVVSADISAIKPS